MDVKPIYNRNFDRYPHEGAGLVTVDRVVQFEDGDLMVFAVDSEGKPTQGILLHRSAVWAIKARTT